jgi:hypothetical protein
MNRRIYSTEAQRQAEQDLRNVCRLADYRLKRHLAGLRDHPRRRRTDPPPPDAA